MHEARRIRILVEELDHEWDRGDWVEFPKRQAAHHAAIRVLAFEHEPRAVN
ncbi:MAG: hypothetical protein JKY65_20050 [Planctomycetes bacterium]|nr:hypothetical protein [Planctomycetota bacterium]